MESLRSTLFLIGLASGLFLVLLPLPLRAEPQEARCAPRQFPHLALHGDTAEGHWLVYRNTKSGLSFRYPTSIRVEEENLAKFPDNNVIVDLMGDGLKNPDINVMRFICARGQKTPEMAAARARALRETHPEEDSTGRVSDGTVGSLQVDGHEAIVSCGCGRGACQWRVLTLQPLECIIFPMEPGEGSDDSLPPPHDGEFPLLSIINTIHFESATK